jgi:hypothetical protein
MSQADGKADVCFLSLQQDTAGIIAKEEDSLAWQRLRGAFEKLSGEEHK